MSLCTAWLALSSGCASSRHSAPPITPDTPAPGQAASAVIDGTANPTQVSSAAIRESSTLVTKPLPGNPAPDSYAYRDDARQLAQDLAKTYGLDPDWTWSALAQARYKASVARLIMPAPSNTAKNWAAYRSRFVEPLRVKAGVAFWRDNEAALRRAEASYGVPAEVIVGILGVETFYGRQTGQFRLIDVLTTLSLDFPKGRSDRSAFFRAELGQFLKLCQEQGSAPDAILGSYAGAIGLPQFMPSSIRQYAVDFDGDGHIDLQGSVTDAIGSVGHYLADHGWVRDQPSYFEVTPPKDQNARDKLLRPDIVPSFSPSEMADLGAQLPETALKHQGPLALVVLYNAAAAPTMIAGTTNFYAITRYNQSSYYALAVIQLGQAVAREASRKQ